MQEKYFGLIQQQITEFPRQSVRINDGLDFNFVKTLKKIDYYLNSRFLTGNKDKDGFKKFFFNIVRHRVNAATKAIDIDTKHIRIISEDGQSYYVSWMFEQELKQFMKDEGFAELFNQIAEKLPRYGTVVVKNVNGVPKICLLRNLVYDQSVTIEESSYKHELIELTREEFIEHAKNHYWENVQEVLDLYDNQRVSIIRVVESYLYIDGTDMENEQEAQVYAKVITAGTEFYNDDPNNQKNIKPIVLFQPSAVDKEVYRTLRWDEEEGRGPGVGIVEDLFDNQESINELTILQRKGLYWATKKVFQTRDTNVPSNLFSKVTNGTVLTPKDPIQQVDMSERNLPQYSSEFQRLENNSDERSFTFEVNTGQSLPSGTPFRLGAILSNAVDSYYEYKREKIGLFIKGLIYDFVIPQFKKNKRKSHVLNFSGDSEQINKIKEFLTESILDDQVNKFIKEFDRYPSIEELEDQKQQVLTKLSSKKSVFMEVPDNFYDNLKYKIDIVITGESENVESNIETLTTVWQILSQKGDPREAQVLDMIMNQAGQNPRGVLGVTENKSQTPLNALGGGGLGPSLEAGLQTNVQPV